MALAVVALFTSVVALARALAMRSSSAVTEATAWSRVALSLAASAVLKQMIQRTPGVESIFASFTWRWSFTKVNRPCRDRASAASPALSRIRSPAIHCPPPLRR